MAGRKAIPKVSRVAVYDKTQGHCWYCGQDISRNWSNWHMDHVVPVSKGGSDSLQNLVPACSSCNFDKKNCHLEDYRIEATQRAVKEIREMANWLSVDYPKVSASLSEVADEISRQGLRFWGEESHQISHYEI